MQGQRVSSPRGEPKNGKISRVARTLLKSCWMSLGRLVAFSVPLLVAAESGAVPVLTFVSRDADKRANEGVNRVDCLASEVWEFSYSCAGFAHVAFWVGDNCATATNRNGSNPTCSELKSEESPSPLNQTLTVLAGQFADPFDDTFVACPEVDTTTSVFVIDLLDSSSDATSFSQYDVMVDTNPPPAPTEVTAEPGEGNAIVNWTDETDAPED